MIQIQIQNIDRLGAIILIALFDSLTDFSWLLMCVLKAYIHRYIGVYGPAMEYVYIDSTLAYSRWTDI